MLPFDTPAVATALQAGDIEKLKRAIVEKGVRFQIMACTGDEKEVAWLNEFDEAFDEVDVTDDYESEKEEVLRAGRVQSFSRGDWIMKALLGPVVKSYDAADEAPTTAAGPFATKAGGASAEALGSVQRNALRAGRSGSGAFQLTCPRSGACGAGEAAGRVLLLVFSAYFFCAVHDKHEHWYNEIRKPHRCRQNRILQEWSQPLP